MGVSGAKKATIYDDVTDTYVELKLISQDSEFNLEGLGEEDLNGAELWTEDRAALTLAFYDDDETNVAQLKAWQKAHTPLKAIVEGLADYIFWDQPSTILVTEPNDFRPRRRNIRRVVMKARGTALPVERSKGYEVVDSEGVVLQGFIGSGPTQKGIKTRPIPTEPEASFGAEGLISWTVADTTYEMDTIILNTPN